jgi:hypothetical protein
MAIVYLGRSVVSDYMGLKNSCARISSRVRRLSGSNTKILSMRSLA